MRPLLSFSLGREGDALSSALIPRSKLGSVISRGGLCAPENALCDFVVEVSESGACRGVRVCIDVFITSARNGGKEEGAGGRERRGGEGVGSFECHP